MDTCPSDDLWRIYLMEGLSPEEDEALTAHAETCAVCTQTLLGLAPAEPARAPARPGEPTPPPELMERLRGLWGHAEPEPPGEDAEDPWPQITGYEVVRVLGRGGMGVVYEARHVALNRTVALKTIRRRRDAAPRGEEVSRFLREAEAVARVSDPGIVPIYEVGRDADGFPYMALEFCPGGSLAARLADGPLPPREAAAMARALALGLYKVHACGVLHRDVTPANVLAAADGTWKLTDFGLAKLAEAPQRLTQTGVVRGTPLYMAPERFQEGPAEPDGRSDVYSLGAVLYEALAGVPPFQGASVADVVHQVASVEPVPLRQRRGEVPRDLETICLKCLEKEPVRRYASAEALADDLRRFLADEPILARPPGALRRGWKWCRRHPVRAALACAGVGMLLILLVGLFFLNAEKNRTELARQGEESQRIEAQAQEAVTRATLDFVESKVFAAARPKDQEGGMGYDVKLADALKASLRFVETRFKDQPLVEARLRLTLGNSFEENKGGGKQRKTKGTA
ncbi:MAG TPA: serine/threonine-protein kinase [Gemmataceae bacterium]|nr:serine/threonine-protein kinase [Gemmataceae bacterium]